MCHLTVIQIRSIYICTTLIGKPRLLGIVMSQGRNFLLVYRLYLQHPDLRKRFLGEVWYVLVTCVSI